MEPGAVALLQTSCLPSAAVESVGGGGEADQDQAVGAHDQAVGAHDQAVGAHDQAVGAHVVQLRWSALQPLAEQFMATDDDLGGAVLKCYG